MDGKGSCSFPDGQEFQGYYKLGMREGRGSLVFAEGAVYEGRFREDKMDGQGTLKILRTVPGAGEGEVFVPVQVCLFINAHMLTYTCTHTYIYTSMQKYMYYVS